MIPLVGFASELAVLRGRVDALIAAAGDLPPIPVGTMIELPRAALTADEIARHADFFSFGTNDLTQTALGISRDDAAGFLADYARRGVLDFDPFATLDRDGVGRLVEMGTQRGRATKPGLDVGICGEHGGDPASIAFCHRAGLDSVSCSPFRVPVARLAAARAALGD
jgi:pyruvate,orthophosphate dikinase